MSNKDQNFRRIYPAKEALLFDGGLDNKYSRALIPNNESPDCANVVFDDGSVGTRDGVIKLNTAPCGTSVAFNGLYTRRDNSGSETMVAFAGTDMYYLNATTFITVPSAQGVWSAGNRVAADTAENYMFFGASGTVVPYKYDGTYFTRHGVYPPTTTAAVASNGAGVLTASGQYRYKVTYVNTNLVESDVGPLTATFTVSSSSGQLRVSSIPLAATSFGINARKLYRNANSDQTVFKLVTTISDNTTTTYDDNIADSALGAVAPTDNGVPPNYDAIIYHRNILFVNDLANPNLVWYSNIADPYTFPSTNFFKVGDKTSDLVRGFGVYEDHLVIFCDKSVWINYMPDPATDSGWRQLKTNSPYGCKSPHAIIPMTIAPNNVLLYPAIQQSSSFVGFAALIGTTVDPTSTNLQVSGAGSDLQSDRIEPDMFLVQSTYVENISGISFKNKAYVSLCYGSGIIRNNRIYCIDYSPSNLSKEQKISYVPFTGLAIEQMAVFSGALYGCSSGTDGFVYKITPTNVYNDDGSAIDSYYWTKEYSGYDSDFNYQKDFRYMNLLVDNAGNYNMNVAYRTDSDSDDGTVVTVNMLTGGSVWDAMVWDTDLWGGGRDQSEYRIFLGSARGKRIQFKFSNQNTVDQRFKVHRANFAYNVKGFR